MSDEQQRQEQEAVNETKADSHEGTGSEPRVGVYVCHCGGNISDVVDVKKVVEAASKLPHVKVARDYTAMCSQIGQELIENDIREHKLDRVVVAACSPSLHEATFRSVVARSGGNPYQYEHVNIREQDSWCSASDPQGATIKAACLVAAGVAKVTRSQPLAPIPLEAKQQVVVVGGGVSGLRTALNLARAGLKVIVLERSPWLGGHVPRWSRLYPNDADPKKTVQELIDAVVAHPSVTVYTSAQIEQVGGCMGDFQLTVKVTPTGVSEQLDEASLQKAVEACPEEVPSEFDFGLTTRKALMQRRGVTFGPAAAIDWEHCTRCGKCVEAVGGQGISLEQQPQTLTLEAGALVLATGFQLYEPAKGELGYGELPQVITLAQLERLLDPDGPTKGRLEVNGQPVKNVCVIHCVGSRQIEGVHQPGPDGVLHQHCSRVCCTAALRAVTELKRAFPDVNVFELYRDIRTYGRGHEELYEQAGRDGVVFIRYPDEELPTVTAGDGAGAPVVVRTRDLLTFGEEVEIPADLVVLATGMLPSRIDELVEMLKLPRSADGFLQEVHPKLRPVEMAVSGVFIAGTCQAPMDVGEACAAGAAAAAKVAGLLGKGKIELDPYRARVDLDRCKGEGKCVEACAYQKAITLVEVEVDGQKVRRAQVNSALCTGCGMCVPVCPNGAIEVAGWSMSQFEGMVDALVEQYAQFEV